MELKDVRTRDDFIRYLTFTYTPEQLNQKPSDAADWFVAVVNAKSIFDNFTTKDLASTLLDGLQPIRYSDDAHAEFFNSFFEDADAWREEGDLEAAQNNEEDAVNILTELLNDHFGGR